MMPWSVLAQPAPTVTPTQSPAVPGAGSTPQVGQMSALSFPGGIYPPEPCKSADSEERSFCPGMGAPGSQTKAGTACTFDDWLKDKRQNLWVHDPEITALGKGGERSRQFISWVLSHPSDDDSPNIMSVWKLSRNIAYFMLYSNWF